MIEISGRRIGSKYPPYFVADVGANHDGSLSRALDLVYLASEAGADAVKFQNFRAGLIVSRRGFDERGKTAHQAEWGQSVYDTYRDYSMPLDWIPQLARACSEAQVAFMTTPYDLELVDLIDPYVPAWKIGSGDITYYELIRKVVSKDKPVLMATGASTGEEVGRASNIVWDGNRDADLVLMQCNTNYEGNLDAFRYLNLNVIWGWSEGSAEAYLTGLSDHTLGHTAVVAAVALGACVFEKHFTDDRNRKGPDHGFAMEPSDWALMVQEANATWEMLGDGRKRVEENELESRIVQRRALRWTRDLLATQCVDRGAIAATRPCPEGALEPYQIDTVIGKTLKRDVEADTLVRLEDLE